MLGRDAVAAELEMGFVLMRLLYGSWNAADCLQPSEGLHADSCGSQRCLCTADQRFNQ